MLPILNLFSFDVPLAGTQLGFCEGVQLRGITPYYMCNETSFSDLCGSGGGLGTTGELRKCIIFYDLCCILSNVFIISIVLPKSLD